ncbi:unknown [Cowpox virus]|uniref:CPXV174 protein n=1 Tax=Cowpox virus TaxID=10243 RepID=Q0NPR8_COWPX|nr:unknown [Cowpox virus]CRL86959.1 CPXV174 protein [Cowpox virus]SNB49381.1 CPXV174 protein [Cowpox virus]SPN68010.1 CPXV174 protein [Cowpox virus]
MNSFFYSLFMKLCCISTDKTGSKESDRKNKNKDYIEHDYYKIVIVPGSSSTSTSSWYYTHA